MLFTYRRTEQDQTFAQAMPNPIRERAQGRPFYIIQIKLWSDDVSGNRTRQWNKHAQPLKPVEVSTRVTLAPDHRIEEGRWPCIPVKRV